MKKILLTVLGIFCLNVAMAQIRVTGTITASDDGSPIPMASVMIKGNARLATSSDLSGNYVLTNVPGDGILVVSFVGYTTQEIPINNRGQINVVLAPDDTMLEEVMVVAYGTAKKGTFTGAASVVRQEVIKDAPNTSFQNALNGRVAGLNVTTRSGQAGTTPTLRIRGTGSMNASNEPLYVIDGVPVISGSAGQVGGALAADFGNIMGSLNPSDIESVTVLKDAAASALYGSRAANGVVLVQTKRGQTGKPKINFKASVGITPSFAFDNWEVASTEQNIEMYYKMFWNAEVSDGGTAEAGSREALRQLNNRFTRHGYHFEAPDHTYNSLTITGERAGKYFDWEDALLRTASFQTYDLSVSGATEQTNYYTSLSYTKEKGRNIMNDYDRISARVNFSQKIGKILEFSSNINLSRSNNKGFNDSRNTSTNPIMQLRNLLWGMYWPTNYVDGTDWTARYGSYAYNQIYYNNEWDNGGRTLRISAVETLTAHILPGLDLRTVASYDDTQTTEFLYYSRNHYSASNVGGSIDNYSTNINKMVSSTTLNFSKEFEGGHNFTFLAGFEAEKNETEYQRASGTDLPTSVLHTVSTAGKLDAAGYSWGHNMMSVLSRAEYSYNNKYYLSGSFRRDGSSRLGLNTRWGNFWSVGASWRIKNEAFMKDVDWVSSLRLRASYGVNGTLPSSNYGHMSLSSYGSKYMTNPGGTLSTVPNPDLSWETSYTYNIALEFGLLENRIMGTLEYFNRDSKNLLQSVPISTITGLGSTLSNVGEMNNHGLEIEISGDIIKSKDFRWNVGLTASLIKSKITDLYGDADIIFNESMDSRARYIYREGHSPLSLYGREWAGVDRETGENLWYLNNNNAADKTINGRAVSYNYSRASEVILGVVDPKVFGGINTSFGWRNLSLDLGFIYKIGGYTYDSVGRDVTDDGYYWERVRSKDQYYNQWTPENKDAIYPMMNAIDMEDVNQKSSRHMHSGTFMRLKTLTLSYVLPKNILDKVGATNTRVYFSGTNLLTMAKYKVYDPEVGSDGSAGWEMPLGKTFTFGIEIGF